MGHDVFKETAALSSREPIFNLHKIYIIVTKPLYTEFQIAKYVRFQLHHN